MRKFILVSIAVIGFSFSLIAQGKKKLPPKNVEGIGEVYLVVDEMPRFPGCEDLLKSNEERVACGNKKMLEYIYSNLKFPEDARLHAVTGQVVLQFIITKDGSIKNIKLARDLGHGCGEEAMRVVESMSNLPEKWTPGREKGELVNVKYTLPVVFKYEKPDLRKRKKRRSRRNN